MPGVYRVNECVESGELAVVIVQIFVSYTKESGPQTNMNRNHSRSWSRRMMWSSWWVLLQLEVTLVYLSLHLCLFGDTSLPRMSYDLSVFWLMAFSFPVLPTLITFCPTQGWTLLRNRLLYFLWSLGAYVLSATGNCDDIQGELRFLDEPLGKWWMQLSATLALCHCQLPLTQAHFISIYIHFPSTNIIKGSKAFHFVRMRLEKRFYNF